MRLIIRFIFIFVSIFLFNTYIYAYTKYSIGDIVPYNDMNFYVIKNSGEDDKTVTLLKAEPLTFEEVQAYSSGIDADVSNYYGYGTMEYYTSDTCGWINETGCTTNYEQSKVKIVVDAWKDDKISEALCVRLMQYDELFNNLGFERWSPNTQKGEPTQDTPKFFKESGSTYYAYWTMSSWGDSSSGVCEISSYASIDFMSVYNSATVRPVIVLSKVVLGDEDESIIDDTNLDDDNSNEEINENKEENKDNKDNETKEVVDSKDDKKVDIVKVANTYMEKSIIAIIIGYIFASVGILGYYKISNKKSNVVKK